MRRDGAVRICGQEVHVSVRGDIGAADGPPPLLLLMGLGGNTGMWEPLRGILDETRPTVAFDVPGTGRSPAPLLPLPLPVIGALAVRVLDHLDIRRADVAGVSWGGLLAQQIALATPGRVRRLVLANTHFGLGSLPGSPGALRTLLSTDRYRRSDALAEAAANFGGRAVQMGEPMRVHAAARLAHPPSTRGYLYQMLALSCWSSLPLLPVLRHPVLLLAGGDDPAVPAVNARLMARLLPAAELVVVPDGGHLMLFDQAEEMAAVLAAFLDR